MNKLLQNVSPPDSEIELMQRVEQIAGLSLSELSSCLNVDMPKDLSRHKGWVGQLLEHCLGATAGPSAVQDFQALGIELKTLPISHSYSALETTYVCYAHLIGNQGITWEQSNVRNKLSRVLWIPVEGEREIPLEQRRVGMGFIWQPSLEQDALLKQDWEELMDMIALGQVESITARIGQVMQLRPKAADGSKLTKAIGVNGEFIETRPRGFYLKKNFTNQILADVFG